MSKAMNIDNCYECKYFVPGGNFNSTDIKEPKPSYCSKLNEAMRDFMDVFGSIYKDCPLEDVPND